MIRHVCITVSLTVVIFSGLLSEAIGSNSSETGDSPTNAINANPLALAFGGLNATYEHLFGDRHGLMVQSGFTFKGGYGVAFHYRYHFFTKPSHHGISSPFWGPFIHFEQGPTSAWVEEDGERTDYDIDVTFLKIGLNVGRRWVWGAFNLAFRIGYGYPVIADFKWSPDEPEQVETMEAVSKVLAGIDGELSIGFAF